MGRLDKPTRKALSVVDLERYPVWVWDDAQENHQPISESEPSPEDYGVLFVRARFRTQDGYQFDGYLIGGTAFYAFGLFVAGREFVMNLNMPDMISANLAEIFSLRKCPPFELFPLSYCSSVRFKNGQVVSGTLNR